MGYTAEDELLIKEKWDDLLLSCTKICKNDEDWNFIKRAFFLAKEAHEGVRRRSGEPYLLHPIAVAKIVIDSVAALTPKAEIEGEMGESKMGLQARLMSQALRKLTSSISKTKTVCIFINQLRDKIGVVYGNPETTTGGNALKFYASVRIDIRRVSVIKDGDEQLGTRTKVKVVKNKVAPPFKRAEFDIMFGEGISKIGEIIDLGVDYGVIKKAGSWFSYGDKKIGQGRDAVKELLQNDEELRNEIEANVREAMKTKKE